MFVIAAKHGRVNGAGRYRGDPRRDVADLNERHLRGTQTELLQAQPKTVVGSRPENAQTHFFTDQIGWRLDRRVDDHHLSKPIESGDRDQARSGNPRVNRLRPAGKTKLHVAAQQYVDRSAGNVDRFHAEAMTAKHAGLHT